MILVTGAAGKTGRAVIRALVDAGESVRAMIRLPEHRGRVEELGAKEIIVGDLLDRPAVETAVNGVGRCYHICPNVHPQESIIGSLIISCASAARVERFVLHSVLHPQTQSMPHHWAKLQVEEMLLESNLEFTILQPCAYMQNVLGVWNSIVEQGIYPVPYRADSKMSWIDLEDVAAIASMVLTKEGHCGATYELCGPDNLTPREIAKILGRQLNRTITVEVCSVDHWSRSAAEAGMGKESIATLVRMFEYYDRFGFWGNPRVASGLLGSSPASFSDFISRTVKGAKI